MSNTVISIENISKSYQLGAINTGTFRGDLQRWWAKQRGKPDPYSKIGEKDHGNRDGETLWALKDVNFQVQQGEVLGIIGRNGAGKSTLLKILSRVTVPTSGEIKVKGRIASLLEVGTGFHPELTGRENIFLNGAIMGMNKVEISRKFDEIVDFSGVEQFIDTPVKRYSSGMYVRLAFAVAAHLEPEILVVDEVLAVGDAEFQKKCLGKMGDVAHEGRTVLFVSHNMAAVRSLCSRGFVLESGELFWSGMIEECIDKYLISSNSNTNCELDTDKLSRPLSGVDDKETLRITHVKLDSPSGYTILKTSEPLSLMIKFQINQTLHNVVFGFTIESSDNVRLFDCRSSDSFGPIANLKPGNYSIHTIVQRNPLNPGVYKLSVGARCENKGLDYLPDLIVFHVETKERYDSLWLEKPSGQFRVLSIWNLIDIGE